MAEIKIKDEPFKDPSKLLDGLGNYLIGKIEEGFETEQRGQFKWPPRRVPNVAGILSDLQKGFNIKPDRFEERPVLVDSGELKRRWAKDKTADSVRVGSTVSHAEQHQKGEISKFQITDIMKENLKLLLRKLRGTTRKAKQEDKDKIKKIPSIKKDQKAHLQRLGWAFRKEQLEIKLRQRPMAIITEQEASEIAQQTKEFFEK